MRHLSRFDRFFAEIDHGLRVSLADAPEPQRKNPAGNKQSPDSDSKQNVHTAGLMRINHTGEVCAQALYKGQAAVAKSTSTRAQLEQAAQEESDHLSWCAARLDELNSRPSILNPIWYASSFAIGATAGLISDKLSLGFVVETERQVEAHLADHMEQIPVEDQRSHAILAQMAIDEAEHADHALASGGVELPKPIKKLMTTMADVMRFAAYRF